jgi:hypothetical protein
MSSSADVGTQGKKDRGVPGKRFGLSRGDQMKEIEGGRT